MEAERPITQNRSVLEGVVSPLPLTLANLKAYKRGSEIIYGDWALASTPHPRREATAPGSREFQFYLSKAPEINRRYAGKHVAIVGDRIVASGKSPLEVYKRAKKSHPQSRPLLAYVPKGETLVLNSI
jgi:uncharacterized protein DUF5678